MGYILSIDGNTTRIGHTAASETATNCLLAGHLGNFGTHEIFRRHVEFHVEETVTAKQKTRMLSGSFVKCG